MTPLSALTLWIWHRGQQRLPCAFKDLFMGLPGLEYNVSITIAMQTTLRG